MSAGGASAFGELLRTYRTAAALTQEELAARAGLSPRGISDLERGARRAPRLETVRMLADALGLGPEDRAAFLAAARQPVAATQPRQPAPPREHPPSRLPVPPTPLIGRAREIASLDGMLRDAAVRLITLSGPGGVGKTRLAVAAAAAVTPAFADGAHFVELAPVADPDLVASAAADVLGVREAGGEPVRAGLERFLRTKRLLLVLDNFEHVVAAAPLVAHLLAGCPDLKVLATSRAPLRLRGERQVPVPPLRLESSVERRESGRRTLVSRLSSLDSDAVRLFVARARDVSPDFALNDANAAAVVEICRRLDGLPLAIELAAARSKVLPPLALLARIERRLPLLAGGPRDLPDRHRTLRNAMAWSHDLLSREEQVLFRRLAVFSGGWTIEAAEVVGGGQDDLDVLSVLETLVNASLVQSAVQPDGEPRVTMLETIREFAAERLEASGEADELGRRHADYYLALAQAGAADLADAAGGGWLTRLEAEQANLRAALTWLRDRGANGTGLRLAAALGGFWRLRNTAAEGRAWLETFLARTAVEETSTTDRVAAFRWAGELAGLERDLETTEARLTESLALARRAGDKRGIAATLGAIGSALFQHVDPARSIAAFEEAAALSRELGDARQTSFLLAYLAIAVGHQGDLTRGEALAAESETLVASLGDTRSFEASFVVMVHGWLALMGGDIDRADEQFELALGRGRALGAKGIVSATLAGLGEVALVRGQIETAAARYREGLALGWEAGFPTGTVFNLPGLVRVASRGDFPRAARLVGVMDAFGGLPQAMPGTAAALYEADVATVRQALGEDAFAAARAAGRAMPVEEAVAEALALADAIAVDPVARIVTS